MSDLLLFRNTSTPTGKPQKRGHSGIVVPCAPWSDLQIFYFGQDMGSNPCPPTSSRLHVATTRIHPLITTDPAGMTSATKTTGTHDISEFVQRVVGDSCHSKASLGPALRRGTHQENMYL